MGGVDALALEVLEGHVGEDIVPERADHRDAGAEARGHHGLVGALPAEAHDEVVADERLAGVRHALGVGDEVDVQAADDGDGGVDPTLGIPAIVRTARGRSGCTRT